MKTYKERFATFTSWPHALPHPEDLAAAGFKYRPTKRCPDNVRCTDCMMNLDEWESDDDPLTEHAIHSPNCQFVKEAQKPTPTPQDIGFFDPWPQKDDPELHLYHDLVPFTDHLLESINQYRETDILQLLPKCLRGAAFVWYQDIQKTSSLKEVDGSNRSLSLWIGALLSKFRKRTVAPSLPNGSAAQKAPQTTPQQDSAPQQQQHHKSHDDDDDDHRAAENSEGRHRQASVSSDVTITSEQCAARLQFELSMDKISQQAKVNLPNSSPGVQAQVIDSATVQQSGPVLSEHGLTSAEHTPQANSGGALQDDTRSICSSVSDEAIVFTPESSDVGSECGNSASGDSDSADVGSNGHSDDNNGRQNLL